jgi:hypothetical protein
LIRLAARSSLAVRPLLMIRPKIRVKPYYISPLDAEMQSSYNGSTLTVGRS